ncbi:MAG: outer membrane lipoprotein-sorting protein [Luteolibacter sp.]
MKSSYQLIAAAVLAISANAAEPTAISAKDLAAKLSALQQDGSSFVRLKMDVTPAGGAPKFGMQLQIKQRRTANSTELVYQVLWPKERAGEAVLLKSSGGQSSGTVFTPPNTVKSLTASQMKEPLFGSALSYSDLLENFFAWDDQKIVGTEVVDKVNCQILESRAGKGAPIVRSWIDVRRFVPMRVEKYLASGTPYRRIETTHVASDDMNRNLPANLTIHDLQKGTTTELDGSKLKHGVKFSDSEFTPQGLNQVTAPRSGE